LVRPLSTAIFEWTVDRFLDDLAEIGSVPKWQAVLPVEVANMSSLRLTFIAGAIVLTSRVTLGADRLDLSPQYTANSLTHVTIQLDAGGHNLVRADGKDQPQEKAEDQKLPISVVAKLGYDERRLTDTSAKIEAGSPLAVRYYDMAEAVLKVGEGGRAPQLQDDHRLIVLEQAEQRPLLFCPESPLSREELDLIDVVGDSFNVDRLLPTKPVSQGDSWASDAKVMGALLTLDTVAVCEVQSILEEFNGDFAKIRLAGTVHGTADGAATQQEVRGVYLFDRRLHRVTRLNLAVHEVRSIGGATPGLDAVAKLQILVTPIAKSANLGDDVVARIKRQAHAPTRDLSFESPTVGLRVKHDRQWYVTVEGREAVTFRRVDNGDLAAQCTLTQLPPKSEGRQTSLEQFQKDVTYSLGKSFGELVSSRQWQNAAGLYCYEVIARGLVEELPVEWHYYLVAPTSGARVSVIVTIEKPMLERVGHADRDLVDSLQLFPATPGAKTAAGPALNIVK
jgi:hypothetical protein